MRDDIVRTCRDCGMPMFAREFPNRFPATFECRELTCPSAGIAQYPDANGRDRGPQERPRFMLRANLTAWWERFTAWWMR